MFTIIVSAGFVFKWLSHLPKLHKPYSSSYFISIFLSFSFFLIYFPYITLSAFCFVCSVPCTVTIIQVSFLFFFHQTLESIFYFKTECHLFLLSFSKLINFCSALDNHFFLAETYILASSIFLFVLYSWGGGTELSICSSYISLLPVGIMKMVRLEKRSHFQDILLNFLSYFIDKESRIKKPRHDLQSVIRQTIWTGLTTASNHTWEAHPNGYICLVIPGCSRFRLSGEGPGQKGIWENPNHPSGMVWAHCFEHLDSWSRWTRSVLYRRVCLSLGQSFLNSAYAGNKASGCSPALFWPTPAHSATGACQSWMLDHDFYRLRDFYRLVLNLSNKSLTTWLTQDWWG